VLLSIAYRRSAFALGAITSTMALGAEEVPRPRTYEALVVMDLMSAACSGSFNDRHRSTAVAD
jgi:hypothetical protein